MKKRWYIKGMMTEMTSVLIEKDVLRWKQRVMKSEKRAVAVEAENCNMFLDCRKARCSSKKISKP